MMVKKGVLMGGDRDNELTKVLSCSFQEAMEHMVIIYKRRINRRVVVMICQIRGESCRSQFLNLVIRDELTNRWISLRLSTVRKVIKWLKDKQFLTARRLTHVEKLKMDVRHHFQKLGLESEENEV